MKVMNIFITGGTSGIGQALAQWYLEHGHRVAVCGRNIDRVEELNSYGNFSKYKVDVYDKTILEEAVCDFCNGRNLDMLIVSAGNYSNDIMHKITYEQASQMLQVNIAGALNALEVARQTMSISGGHIVVLASVAGLLDYPQASTYAKCKRVLIQIADTYRRSLSDFGIIVTTIIPGYIDTPRLREIYNGDISKCPFCIPLDKATKIMTDAIDKHKDVVVFPWKMRVSIGILSLFPKRLLSIIMYRKAKWNTPK